MVQGMPYLILPNRAFQVKIGGVTLGKNAFRPDQSVANPISIEWSWTAVVVKHDTVGTKPKTQCTCPDGLWTLTIRTKTWQFDDVFQELLTMKAGPVQVATAVQTKCMYLIGKKILQVAGTDDTYQEFSMSFEEANDG